MFTKIENVHDLKKNHEFEKMFTKCKNKKEKEN